MKNLLQRTALLASGIVIVALITGCAGTTQSVKVGFHHSNIEQEPDGGVLGPDAGGTVGIVIEESGVTWINLCGEFGYTFGEEEDVKNNTRLMTNRIPMELCNNFRVGQSRDGIQ